MRSHYWPHRTQSQQPPRAAAMLCLFAIDQAGKPDCRAASGVVAQHDTQQGPVDLQVAVIGDEAELPELVHEMADPGPRRADDLGQGLLADRRGDRLRAAILAEARQDEQRACQALLARVEELVD